MKRLTNISPFLLLLVPVFMMMALTFASTYASNKSEEVALRSSTSSKGSLIKIINPFSK